MTIRRGGRTIDAVAQATKHGFLFVFDRASGEPVFPIEYKEFPASTLPGEVASKTQPIPSKPAPFSRQLLTEDLLSNRTPAVRAVRRSTSSGRSAAAASSFRSSVDKETVVFPGFDGGAEWGGQAFDPDTGLYYVNANDLAWTGSLAPNTGGQSGQALYLQHCATCHRDDRAGTPPQIASLVGIGDRRTFTDLATVVKQGAGRMPGFPQLDADGRERDRAVRADRARTPPRARGGGRAAPAHPLIDNTFRFTGYRKFLDADGYPAVAPPWGTLNAINLNTGDTPGRFRSASIRSSWQQGLTNTGSENYGGPIVTAGGLVFIAATNHDRKIRAFDKATGALLWEATCRPRAMPRRPPTK